MPYNQNNRSAVPARPARKPGVPKRRPGRTYERGRLVKIEPEPSKPCQIIDRTTGEAVTLMARTATKGPKHKVTVFPARKWARLAMGGLIKDLPPKKSKSDPDRYYIQNCTLIELS